MLLLSIPKFKIDDGSDVKQWSWADRKWKEGNRVTFNDSRHGTDSHGRCWISYKKQNASFSATNTHKLFNKWHGRHYATLNSKSLMDYNWMSNNVSLWSASQGHFCTLFTCLSSAFHCSHVEGKPLFRTRYLRPQGHLLPIFPLRWRPMLLETCKIDKGPEMYQWWLQKFDHYISKGEFKSISGNY